MTFFKNWRLYSLFEYKTGNYTYTCLTGGRLAGTPARARATALKMGAGWRHYRGPREHS